MREYCFEIYIAACDEEENVCAASFKDPSEALDALVWLNDHHFDAYLKTYSWICKENKENDS